MRATEGAKTARTPQEVFEHHGDALMAGDIDAIVSDYSDDAVFITADGVRRGKDGLIRVQTVRYTLTPKG